MIKTEADSKAHNHTQDYDTATNDHHEDFTSVPQSTLLKHAPTQRTLERLCVLPMVIT